MTDGRGRRSDKRVLTTHVSAEIRREVHRRAQERGISDSACAAALLADALQGPLEREYAALVQPVVERTVREALYAHLERLGDLAFRAALDSDETRRLVVALLFNAVGSKTAKALRRDAHSAAWQRLQEPAPTPPEADGVCQDSR